MTSQVTRFLPATFTKWFGQSSSANGSAMLTESSTEDEGTKSPITIPPPAKRMRYSPSAKTSSSHFTPISTKTSSTNTEATESFNTTPSTSDKIFRRNTNLLLTPRQKNDECTISTSDSKINNYDLYKSEVHIERKRMSIFDKTQNSDTVIGKAVARSASAKVFSPTQPYFKDGLLSSPYFDTSTSTYGGAGGSFVNQPNVNRRRKAVAKEPNTNNNVSISYSSRRVLDLLENYSSLLTDARRIPSNTTLTTKSLQTQADTQQIKNNSYKMQELHVPQIASLIRLKQKQLMNSNAARQIIASLSSSAPYPQSPISQKESVPEKEKLTTKIKSTLTRTNRKAIENSPAPPPVNLPTIPLQIDKDNLPKILFNSTYTSISTSSIDVAPKTVNTQMNVINNAKDAIMNLYLPNQKPTLCVERTNSLMHQFKFSNPIEISVEQSTGLTTTFSFSSPEKNLDSVKSPTGFTYFLQTESQPKIVGDKTDNVNLKNHTCKGCCCNSGSGKNKCAVSQKKTNSNVSKLPISNTAAPDKWKCSECWVENEKSSVACICCGVKKSGAMTHPSKATDSESAKSVKWKCSDCWIDNDSSASRCVCCGANETAVKSTPSIPAQTNKWRCKDCWVENDSSVQKCICCGGNKSGENTPQPIKPQTLTWKCKDCWIENNRSAAKCVCCGLVNTAANITKQQKTNSLITTIAECKHVAPSNPKPDSKSTNLPFQRTTQSQSDKWECSICLVRNEHNRIKCVCCEVEKPGAKKQPESKFSFKDNPGALFKFGIPAEGKQDTNVQVPSITNETPAKESEVNNNVLPKATFSFGIPKNTEDTAVSVGDRKKDEPIEPMLTFGINKSTSSSTSVEVPQPLFSLPKTPEITSSTVPKKPVVTSEVQPSTPVSTSALIVSDSNLFVSIVTTPISISSNSGLPVTTQSEQKTSTHSLSCSNSPTTTISASSSNVLSTGISAAASTSTLSFSTRMTLPSAVTAATSNIPLFCKTESVKPEPTSLFQKSESTPVYLPVFSSNTTTTTPAVSQLLSTTSAAPVFCFNNTLYNSAPNNEKPKFYFKFGNNSSNETPMLKTFGATSENNIFTLPISNGSVMSTGTSSNSALLGIKGLLTGNTLLGGDNGGNQQNTGNTLSIASSTPETGLFGNPMPNANNIWPTNNDAASTPTQFENRAANFTFNTNTSSTFGAPQQPSQNIFGISNRNTNSSQPNLFFNTAQNPQSNTSGNLLVSNVPMFGATSISNTTFGTSTNTSGVFGFSQQQQPQQPTGMFNFGSGGTTPQVQFNMGSAPYTTAARRVRKAVRRTRR